MENKINFLVWSQLSKEDKENFLKRSETDIKNVHEQVSEIIKNVRERKDEALIEYAKKFDNADIRIEDIKVTEEEFLEAEKSVDPDLKTAIKNCISNVKKFHQSQKDREEKLWISNISKGIWAGEQINPIPSVGLYVPRGKGCFPSVMYMLCIPAKIAAVPEIVVCTPPDSNGKVDSVSLYVASICGVRDIYKVGGSQAIAALAYGTETVPKVSKVTGPGNRYVASAKRLLSDIIDSGMPAGPSESIVLADESANLNNTILDLINEAEHGPDSAAILVTNSKTLANSVRDLLPEYIDKLPETRKNFCYKVFSNYGGIVLTDSLEDSLKFCNEYSVEHLLLKVSSPEEVLPKIYNAGEILIGEYTPVSMGNFGLGVNAILPTGRHADTYSATTVWDYMKRTSIAFMNKEGFDSMKEDVLKISDYEGFPAHSNSIREREFSEDFTDPSEKIKESKNL